jgi:hypothetical protein
MCAASGKLEPPALAVMLARRGRVQFLVRRRRGGRGGSTRVAGTHPPASSPVPTNQRASAQLVYGSVGSPRLCSRVLAGLHMAFKKASER